MAVCMRCLMECGADCEIREQGGQAIGKALETNSTLQSLDLKCELRVGVGQGRGMRLRGMEQRLSTCMEQAGPCDVCAYARTGGRMVHMWVLGDVQCMMGSGVGQRKQCRP